MAGEKKLRGSRRGRRRQDRMQAQLGGNEASGGESTEGVILYPIRQGSLKPQLNHRGRTLGLTPRGGKQGLALWEGENS